MTSKNGSERNKCFIESQILTVKKDMHVSLHCSTSALVTVSESAAPKGGFHHESVCVCANNT